MESEVGSVVEDGLVVVVVEDCLCHCHACHVRAFVCDSLLTKDNVPGEFQEDTCQCHMCICL